MYISILLFPGPHCFIVQVIDFDCVRWSLLRSAELLARTPRAWGLGPRPCRGLRTLSDLSQINGRLRPATSPNHVINTEHINQLSCFHAKKLSVLNFIRFNQALYSLAKSCLWQNSLWKLCLWRAYSNTLFTWGLPWWSFSSCKWLYLYGFVPCSCITPQYAPHWLKRFASWVASLLCLPLRSRLFG